ncbi:hypothetical protein EST38_g7958 [Candolleomyces aberdarensis]|uniref:Uncharacterized protein n=1 Tax=Candolleomyces aberdarensis TaxID=2316362 RepID=A0A4Q2DGL7_9AGAR|nr:hypothetical protein EST38_g7958 [Candolleomyces aberdarensis]
MSSSTTVTDSYFWRVLDGLPDNDLVLDMVLGIILSVSTVILATTSYRMMRLVLLQKACDMDPPSSISAPMASVKGSGRRPSLYVMASFVMFFLFLAATIVYWTKAFLSMKETLCLLRHLPFDQDIASIALQHDSEETRLVVSGCRTALWNGKIINDLDNALCLAFAILAQLFLFIADGLLVYRCYQIFVNVRTVYIPVVVIYVVYFGVSMLQLYPPMKATSEVVNLKSGPFYAVWLATSIAINIVVTAAITTRILLTGLCGWSQPCPTVINILPLLPAVRSFILVDCSYFLRLANLHPALRHAVFDFMSRPTVNAIWLRDIADVDILPIVQKSHLKTLYLGNVHFGTEFDPPLPPSVHNEAASAQDSSCFQSSELVSATGSAFLQILDIWGSGDVYKNILQLTGNPDTRISLTRLRELRMGVLFFDEVMEDAWSRFLDTCAEHVEKYVVYDGGRPRTVNLPEDVDPFHRSVFAFTRFPQLKDLQIVIPTRYFQWFDEHDVTPILLEELEQLSQSTRPSSSCFLETLKIEFTLYNSMCEWVGEPVGFSGIVSRFSKDETLWKGLDRVLGSESGSLSALKDVHITLDLISSDPTVEEEVWERAKGAILDRMPNVGNRINLRALF